MKLSEYQEKARSTAIYHVCEDYDTNICMIYPGLGLVGECGEVAEKIKKLYRDDNSKLTEKRKEDIKKELGDCCWYLANICSDTTFDLQLCYDMKSIPQIQKVRKMTFPQLVLHMNRCASIVAESLELWYYQYDRHTGEYSKFMAIPHNITKILVCVSELASRCGCTLEKVCTGNIEKLLSRKARGKIKGDGDNR